MSDQVFALTPRGDYQVILDDDNEIASGALEQSFRKDDATPELIQATGGTVAP